MKTTIINVREQTLFQKFGVHLFFFHSFHMLL